MLDDETEQFDEVTIVDGLDEIETTDENFYDLSDDYDFDTSELFDLDTTGLSLERRRNVDEQFLKYSDAASLAKRIELFEDCRYFVILNGSFYFGDFIEALITQNDFHVERLTISTLSLNENNIDSLKNLFTGKYLGELELIVSEFFYAHEKHNLIKYLNDELAGENYQLAVARSHCKIAQFETDEGYKIVIHGSANLRTSDNLEQITIEDNKRLFDFNEQWQQAIIEKYRTIDKSKLKSVRGKTLWQSVSGTVQPEEANAPRKRAKAKSQPRKNDAGKPATQPAKPESQDSEQAKSDFRKQKF